MLRVFWFAVREFRADVCFERAATLTFATIISLIPLSVLFVSFAVQLGVGDQVIAFADEKVFHLLAPDFRDMLATWLEENIPKTAFESGLAGVVGIVALVTLILSALGVVVTAERNFNRVWKVTGTRTYIQRLIVFWVILTTSPFLVILARWLEKLIFPSGGWTSESYVGPVVISFVGLTILYRYLPSAHVRFRSAMLGAVVGAILFEISRQSFFLYFFRTSSVYGSLAIVPLFLFWLYIVWSIVLGGCELAYAHQNLEFLSERLEEKRGTVERLPPSFMGVYLLEKIGRAFAGGKDPPRLSAIGKEICAGSSEMERSAQVLVEAGILVEDARRPGLYTLGRAPDLVPLDSVVDLFPGDVIPPQVAASCLRAGPAGQPGAPGEATPLLDLFQAAREQYVAAFAGKTLADLLPAPEAKEAKARTGAS